jgi:hypothetical protein
MDKAGLEALLARIDIWLLVFGAVVVIGVAGESFFGIRHWWNSRKLQSIQNAENEAQRGEIAKAVAQAAAANERSSKLEIEAGEQRERAAKAEHELLELRQRLAWRRISPKEYTAFVAALRQYHGSSVQLSKMADAEAAQFADDILKVLKDSGWNILQVNTLGTIFPPRYGLQCSVKLSTPAGKAVAEILRSLPTAKVENNSALPVIADIFVGLKQAP